MRVRQNIIDFYNHLISDEELLRLLVYEPQTYNDNPLDLNKPNIIGHTNQWTWIDDRVKMSPKINDLSTKPICRVCLYLGHRSNSKGNSNIASQDVVFDVYVHIDKFDVIDVRSLWICDKINELMSDQWITGIGKVKSSQNYIITNPPDNYIGYKLIFTFGSAKK